MTTTAPVVSYQADVATVTQMTEAYFQGLYTADTTKLETLFHEDCVLKAPGIRRSREVWLSAVASRPVPKAEGHDYAYQILSVDVVGDQAMVKVICPLLDHVYVDFLGFLREEVTWRIVTKMYADI